MTKLFYSFTLLLIAGAPSIACVHSATQGSIKLHEQMFGPPPPCDSQIGVDETCSIATDRVHPTQFSLGLKDVQKKRLKISEIKNDPKKLRDFLKKKTTPAIKGPEDVFYIVDGHHTTRALSEESVATMYIKILKDYSRLAISKFWEKMKAENFVWLYDENGNGPQNPIYIPESVNDLRDDPYRSLAEDAQQKGAYDEKPVLYQQFYWANYFRKLIPKEKLIYQYDEAVTDATNLAKLPDASQLPGFHP